MSSGELYIFSIVYHDQMKPHKDKGRYLIAQGILESNKTSPQLKDVALKCILAYCGEWV